MHLAESAATAKQSPSLSLTASAPAVPSRLHAVANCWLSVAECSLSCADTGLHLLQCQAFDALQLPLLCNPIATNFCLLVVLARQCSACRLATAVALRQWGAAEICLSSGLLAHLCSPKSETSKQGCEFRYACLQVRQASSHKHVLAAIISDDKYRWDMHAPLSLVMQSFGTVLLHCQQPC